MTRIRIAKRVVRKTTNRRWCKCGFFEILTCTLSVVYVYYISVTFILISDTSHMANGTRFRSLFKILKRNPPSPTSAALKILPEDRINRIKDGIQECTVTLAIILCEDDRYLSVKNKSAPKAERGSLAKDFSRQINQTLVLMKSIAILTKYDKSPSATFSCVEFLFLADKPTHYNLIKEDISTKWSLEFQQLVKITNVPVRYPAGSSWMKKLFRPCATLRLFLAELLPPKLDSVIYLDTDIIFFQSVQELWKHFNRFDDDVNEGEKNIRSKKLAGMAPCLFHYGSSANSVPFYGTSGLNAGIMLMNLTRMRTRQWTNKVRMVTTMFQNMIKLADQDILNIYFHFFPEDLYLVTCDWNFRPFQCRIGSYCTDPELSSGISALHGNALSFTAQGPEPLFHAVFKTFHRAKLDETFNLTSFMRQLELSLIKAEESTHLFTSHCKRYGGLDALLLNRLSSLVE